MSGDQVTKLNVKPAVCEDMKNSIEDDRILTESDLFKEMVIVVGCLEDRPRQRERSSFKQKCYSLNPNQRSINGEDICTSHYNITLHKPTLLLLPEHFLRHRQNEEGERLPPQIMANIIKKCLTNIEQLSLSSITFLMIGTGNLRFPKAIFAELILSEVFKFSNNDDESHQVFLDEFTSQSNRNLNEKRILMAGDTQAILGTVSNPEFETYEMKIGVITFQKKPIIIADDIINAIADFTRKYSTPSLKKVKVVIFPTELLKAFHDSMRKREVSASSTVPSIVSRLHIERTRNVIVWQSYQVKKNHMDTKNGQTDNKRLLFHGTDADTVPYISQHVFNRSNAGMNGVYTRAGIINPPSKNTENPIDLYDSVTGDTQHPKLFVVFSDNHTYPKYLMTFKC
ncbi:hypothetical protein HPG69_010459 [Diceros bicornis minor]|uniref:Poly [ADP-ribose] polymerase n=1 Tax=Diceros bicornis minor TaxID=77932 RepID=A0A7J7F7V0_DICBM|nr:hypothetical protein HPG69_010459 [Diceros bicornis minor]